MSCSILSIPNEIQLAIFHAVHEAEESLRPVSQVCRLWRNLSVNTSIFWTEISIDTSSFDTAVQVDNPWALDILHAHRILPWPTTLLLRSGFRPIDIWVALDDSSDLTPARVAVLSRVLASHVVRARSITITSDVWQHIGILSQRLFGVPMPLLEKWDVTLDKPSLGLMAQADGLPVLPNSVVLQSPLGTVPSTDLHQSLYPKLSHLCINGVTHNWAQLIPRNLVVLDLSNIPLRSRPSYEEIKALLLGSQHTLESLTVYASAPWFSKHIPPGDEKITLPKVRVLILGITFSETIHFLAAHLDVPNLHCLEIYDMTHQNERTWAASELSTLNNLHMHHFYLNALMDWPMKQVTHLTLGTPHSPDEQADFSALNSDFEAGRVPSCRPPVFTTLFLHCTALENLRLIDPDLNTLMALTVAVNLQENAPGILPCSSLEFLHIDTKNYWELTQFFGQMKAHAGYPESRLYGRFIPSILLDVPPAWGASLCEFLSPETCAEILNGEGYFEVDSGRVFNLLDNLV